MLASARGSRRSAHGRVIPPLGQVARRGLLAGALVAVLLAAAGSAHAELVVSGPSIELGASGTTTIELDGEVPAGLVVYVPQGFGASLGQPPGTPLGRASAVLASQGSELETEGPLVAEDPARAACGASGHGAVWRVSLAGAPEEVLVAVDPVGPGDPASAYAAFRLALCVGGDALLRSLDLRVEDVFTTPSRAGAYSWRAVSTPVGASGQPDVASAMESRSTQLLPARLALRGSFDRARGEARLVGALTAAGRALAGARVALAAGRSGSSLVPAGHVSTGAAGRFRVTRRIVDATVFEASADVPARSDPAGCAEPIAPGGCASATLAPLTAVSERVRVRVPPPRVLRVGSRGADVRRLHRELARLRFLPAGSRGARFGERTWHAVVAFQGWRRLPRTGVADRRTWRALRRARVPRPWGGLRRGLQIDTSRQVLLLVEGGRTLRAIHVSTGAFDRTPRGRFAVYRKETLSWSVPFQVWMPYASYFTGGYALHAYSSVPAYAASHGCVRMPPAEAPRVYGFAAYGTPVWVR